MLVDTHVHVISPDEARYPLQPTGITAPWYRDEPCSVEQLVGLMDGAGVDRAVLVQPFSAYLFDNRYAADSARAHPQRCTSVACIDVGAPGAAERLESLARGQGMRGLRWVALAPASSLAEPRGLWESAARLSLPVVVTILSDRLPELAELLPDLPDVPVALDHCGFADFARGVPDELGALAAHPRLHLKVSTHVLDDAAAHGDARELVAELADRFGAERLMWGSDWSQTHHVPYPELVEQGRVAASGLVDADRAAFLGGTALRIWPELG